MKNVLTTGHPALRNLSSEVSVESILSADTQKLIDELIDIMRLRGGVGIAAAQTGEMKRIFIMEVANNRRYPAKNDFPLTVCINPEITIIDHEMVHDWEGCLSIPFYRGLAPRYKKIALSYFNRNGIKESNVLEGFPAVIAQHEFDHLNGILFTDRMTDMKSLTYIEQK